MFTKGTKVYWSEYGLFGVCTGKLINTMVEVEFPNYYQYVSINMLEEVN